MNKALVVLFIFMFAVLSACKKESTISNLPNQTQQKDDSKMFLKDLNSDSPSEYFISGEFDSYKIYLGSTFVEYYPSNDTVMNAIYLNNAIDLDNIHLIRENREMIAFIPVFRIPTKQYGPLIEVQST